MPASDGEQSSGDSEADYASCRDYHSDSSKLGSPMAKERQISVDPSSLHLLPAMPPPPLARPKFVSCSLPASALCSPKLGSVMAGKSSKKWSNFAQPHPAVAFLARQHSAALSRFALEQRTSMRRSKSCGEGRSSEPSDDFFDILSRRPSVERGHAGQDCDDYGGASIFYEMSTVEEGSFEDPRRQARRPSQSDESVKCGCFFLPGLSHKKKQVTLQASRVVPKPDHDGGGGEEESSTGKGRMSSIISRAASLEKFECASWTPSSPVLGCGGVDDDDGCAQAFFDLPLELIRSCNNETESPVKAAFVFDRDVKGVLKKGSSRPSWSQSRGSASSSNRHVRFSTSAPISYPASPSSACVTPRLGKATSEEFDAILEAQIA